MDLNLKNKVVLISGGSKGIGKASALAYAEEGAKVAICARGEEALKETAAEIAAKTGAEIYAASADLTSVKEVEKFVADVHRKFGRIDILVNSAGQTKSGKFLDLTEEDWLASWDGKYFGAVRLTRAVFKIMRDQGGGAIISVHGGSAYTPREGFILKGNVNAGVANFVAAIANEGSQYRIRSHGVSPGAIKTEVLDRLVKQIADSEGISEDDAQKLLTPPIGHIGEARDVANIILFLSSDITSYVQGQSIVIDGGSSGLSK